LPETRVWGSKEKTPPCCSATAPLRIELHWGCGKSSWENALGSAFTIDGEGYTVDPAGNRTAKTDYLAGATSNYTYDRIYELTQTMQGTNTTESYSYDPVGNRLSSLGVSSYTNNTSNELTSDSNASYTYDATGNTTGKTDSTGTTSYTWDFENRLTQVTLPGTGGTVSFKYDPFGRRIQKSFTQGTNTTTMNFVYDGNGLIEQTDQNGSVLARYTQGQNTDEPLAESSAGATSYYEQDGLGSVTSLTNAAGAFAQTYTYDSFGKITNSTGTLTNPFRYTGREFDTETGLYYYRARYFDPNAGRFLSEDPIRFNGGVNLYAYVSNNSPNLGDPNGLLQVCCRPAHQAFASVWAKATLQPPPCHCFLKLSDGTTLSGYFSWSLGSFGDLVTRRDDNSDFNKYKNEAKCTDVPGSPCLNDAKAKKAFGSPKNLGPYGFAQPDVGTSNDAAAGLLKDSGIGYTLPPCAWGKGSGTYHPIGPISPFPPWPFM
jgi:RHS repeat-associated protein